MKAFNFNRRLGDGSFYRLGTAVEYPDGWRFISNVAVHKNSRKFYRTMQKCLPRWLGYPDRCESVAVIPKKDAVGAKLMANSVVGWDDRP